MEISIEKLTKRYPGGKYAIRDIELKISSGVFGLLGPNGAGKTTLMRILVTLLKPTSGKAQIENFDIAQDRKTIRRMVGYLPQDFSNFSRLLVWEFLDYAAALSGLNNKTVRLAKVDQFLEEVGLFDARDRRCDRLSGGMKRRLGIAQTLIGDPKIMIVDEPTVGLDPEERLRFRNLLTELSRKDMIIILSTHIVGDISSTCTEIALLNNGRIGFNGSPDELIGAAEGKVWKVIASHTELDSLKEHYPVISAVPAEKGYELRLVADKIEGKPVDPVPANLEDAYIYFMQTLGTDMNLEATDRDW